MQLPFPSQGVGRFSYYVRLDVSSVSYLGSQTLPQCSGFQWQKIPKTLTYQ